MKKQEQEDQGTKEVQDFVWTEGKSEVPFSTADDDFDEDDGPEFIYKA